VQSGLIVHQRIHGQEHLYTCDVCNKSFRVLNQLKTHHDTYSGECPYSCDVRNKSLNIPGHLKVC